MFIMIEAARSAGDGRDGKAAADLSPHVLVMLRLAAAIFQNGGHLI